MIEDIIRNDGIFFDVEPFYQELESEGLPQTSKAALLRRTLNCRECINYENDEKDMGFAGGIIFRCSGKSEYELLNDPCKKLPKLCGGFKERETNKNVREMLINDIPHHIEEKMLVKYCEDFLRELLKKDNPIKTTKYPRASRPIGQTSIKFGELMSLLVCDLTGKKDKGEKTVNKIIRRNTHYLHDVRFIEKYKVRIMDGKFQIYIQSDFDEAKDHVLLHMKRITPTFYSLIEKNLEIDNVPVHLGSRLLDGSTSFPTVDLRSPTQLKESVKRYLDYCRSFS